MPSSHVLLDQVDITFDDQRPVASAGLLLPATLAERLGIEQATDQLVDLGDRPGAAHPGRKLLTLVHALVAGGDCIDDVELLRAGATGSVLGIGPGATVQVSLDQGKVAGGVGLVGKGVRPGVHHAGQVAVAGLPAAGRQAPHSDPNTRRSGGPTTSRKRPTNQPGTRAGHRPAT
jgi:hypothetical protein